MERTAGQITTSRFNLAATAFFCLGVILLAAGSFAAGGSGGGGNCLLPVGDLNGDGIGDYAYSESPAGHGIGGTAYVIFGGSAPLPAATASAELKQRAAYILRGPSAAPFACPVLPAAPVSRSSAARQLAKMSMPPAGASPIGQPVFYTIGIDFDELSPGRYSLANGINQTGEVAGRFLTAQGLEHAFLFDGTELHDLGTLGGNFSDASAVNAAGLIVGYGLSGETDESGFVNFAFLSDGLVMRDLGIRWSAAADINTPAQIVGEMRVASGDYHAFLYQQDGTIDLGTLDGAASSAYAINDAGQVVGEATTFIAGTAYPSSRGFLFENGAMSDLGSLGYYCPTTDLTEDCEERSSATDVNNQGQVAGFSTTSSYGTHAFLETDGNLEDLGTLGGLQSWAYAVNDSGQVVGTSLTPGDAAYHPFLFDLGSLYDLTDLVVDRPADFTMWGAYDINNFGQIVGINYRLDPVYPSIAPGQAFSFRDTLGAELAFEYWVSAGDYGRCVEQGNQARLEFKLDAVTLDRSARAALGRNLRRWQPVDASSLDCTGSKNWRSAVIAFPPELQGKEATVRLRVRNPGAVMNPTIYLRHFRFSPPN